jgi:hypothetical protein
VKPQTFRIFFWQKLVLFVPLPVFAGLLYITPFTKEWSLQTWSIVGAVVAAGILLYLAKQWSRSGVRLDGDGMTLYLSGELQTWPHEKLLKVKEIGRFRARMCYDPDIADKHMHISFDLLNRDRFVDALLGQYEETTGHELADLDSNLEAA